ncbi:OPT oligopeptide transporter protein-domain-containing protein [Spinellus fusiger]|nr:OPT oligopeptide transporter protein-domain-containing protein [Spinellus fusiger]
MYFGLQTGWISMMSLQSSLLGYAIFKPFQHRLAIAFGPIENVVLQTTAVATATMPLAAGFVGVIPALELLTTVDHPEGSICLSGTQLILWSLGVAFFGVFFAIPLRKQTIIREKLKFPSGTATAQMISLLHHDTTTASAPPATTRTEGQHIIRRAHRMHPQTTDTPHSLQEDVSWAYKLQALVLSFSLSSFYTLLSYFFPAINAIPVFDWITLNTVHLSAWEWYFTPSLSYMGQGIIMGLPTTLSMLLGCFIGWGLLSPLSYYTGWATGPVNDWKTGSKGWILWISLGVMISDSIVSLAIVMVKSLIGSHRHHTDIHVVEEVNQESEEEDAPEDQRVSTVVTAVGLVVSSVMCVYFVRVVFGRDILSIPMALLSVAIAMLLSVLGVRALGETDLNPVSGIGKISQVFFALVMPGNIAANLIAGGIAEAGAQQAGDLMQEIDLKTGHLLHASPKAQFYGQVIGSFFSAFIATGAYLLYRSVYSIPGPEFPVPTAQVWLDMSRLVNGHPLPPHVYEFVLLFAFVFAVCVIIKETTPQQKWHKYIPQGVAFAIGIYNPPSFTLARVLGGVMGHYWNLYCDTLDPTEVYPLEDQSWFKRHRRIVGKVFIVIVASGFVLGEGMFAIVNLIMRSFNVPHY